MSIILFIIIIGKVCLTNTGDVIENVQEQIPPAETSESIKKSRYGRILKPKSPTDYEDL